MFETVTEEPVTFSIGTPLYPYGRPAPHARDVFMSTQRPSNPQSKVIPGRCCQLLAINAHKMAPSMGQWLQVPVWDTTTKSLLWVRNSWRRSLSRTRPTPLPSETGTVHLTNTAPRTPLCPYGIAYRRDYGLLFLP